MRALQRSTSQRKQAGALMLEVSLALIISALAAVGTIRASMRADLMRSADIEADALDMYRTALQRYVDDAYSEIQNGSPVTRNAVTLTAAQSLNPTVAQLIGMNYLSAGFSNSTLLVDGGTYQNAIRRDPVGCVTIACNVEGLAWITVPFFERGTAFTNGPVIGQMLSRLGGFGGTSIEGSTANITGTGASWTQPNPVAGNPAGVMAARFGFSSAAFLNYIRINDLRDPDLFGNLTVAGNTNLKSTLKVDGATQLVGNAQLDGTLTTNGTSLLKGATTLNSTLKVDGATQLVGDVQMDANTITNGTTLLRGATTIGTGGVNANLTVNGDVRGQRLIPTASNAIGGGCAGAEGAISLWSGGTGLLSCQAGVWTALAVQDALGGACAVEGATSKSSAGIGLLCVNGVFRGMDAIVRFGSVGALCGVAGALALDTANNNETLICKSNLAEAAGTLRLMRLRDITSQMVFVAAFEVTGTTGSVVKPNCAASAAHPATPVLQMIPKTFSSDDGGYSFSAVDSGATWTLSMNKATGVMTGTPAVIAQTFCYFN